MKILSFLLLFHITFCSFATESLTDKVILHSTNLSIATKNGKCILRTEGASERVIALNQPCFFMRNKDKNIQHYSYSDVNVDDVLIIVGTPISAEVRQEWDLPENLICGSEAQGVLFKKRIAIVTKNVLKGGVLCKDKGTDEKNYWYFAHEN
jgi:hypothetical protein